MTSKTRRLARESLYTEEDGGMSWPTSAPPPPSYMRGEPMDIDTADTDDYTLPMDHKYELCELLAEFAPKALGDLLKHLVSRKHGGRTVREVLDLAENHNTADLLYKSDCLSHYKQDYYLLPLDERGKPDYSREGAKDYTTYPEPSYLSVRPDSEGWTVYNKGPKDLPSPTYTSAPTPSRGNRDMTPLHVLHQREIASVPDSPLDGPYGKDAFEKWREKNTGYYNVDPKPNKLRRTPADSIPDNQPTQGDGDDDYILPSVPGTPRYDLREAINKKHGGILRPKRSVSQEGDYLHPPETPGGTETPYQYDYTGDYNLGNEDMWRGPVQARADRRDDRYVPTEHMKRYSEKVYEDLTKATTDQQEVAMTYFLLREENISGLAAPPGGWYAVPADNDITFQGRVGQVIHMATNISEVLDLSSKGVLEKLELLKTALKEVCVSIDRGFNSTTRLAYAVSWSWGKGMGGDSEKMNNQLNHLHGVAVADSKLKSSGSDKQYDSLLTKTDEEVYDEIIDDIYNEVDHELYAKIEGDEETTDENKPDSNLNKLEMTNQDLIERTITLSTVVQQSEEKVSEDAIEEANIVSKSLMKAKKVVIKVVDIIRKEIQKVKEKIAQRRAKKQRWKQEKLRLEAARRQVGRPLPEDPPDIEDEGEEEEGDVELDKEVARLNKLEQKEAENNELYSKLDAVDDMLEELVSKKEKGYYEMMVERNTEFLRRSIQFDKSTKDALIVDNVINNKEKKEITQGKKNIDKTQLLIRVLLRKGDYTCRKFLEHLASDKRQRNTYTELLKAEDRWRAQSLSDLLNDQSHVINWDKVIDTVDTSMAMSILKMYSILSQDEFDQVRLAHGEQMRKIALREMLTSHGQEDWDLFMTAIQHQETTLRQMSTTWNENDVLANWQVLMDTLDINMVCTILFSRYIITPRNYADVTSRMALSEKHEVLENTLCHKGKDEWVIFINSLKDRGQGHMMEALIQRQLQKRNEEDSNAPAVAGQFMSYQMLKSESMKSNIHQLIYDHNQRMLYIEFNKKGKMVSIDKPASSAVEFKVSSGGRPLVLDTKRKMAIYGHGEKLLGYSITDKSSRPEVIQDDTGRGTKLSTITYDSLNDLYLITYEGQRGVTLYDPGRKYIVRTIAKEVTAPIICVTSCPANQILVRTEHYISVFNLRGLLQGRHLVGQGGIQVDELASVTADHLRRVLIADSGKRRIVRVKPGGSWEYTHNMAKKPTALVAGHDGTLVLGYADGTMNIYGDKPPEGVKAIPLHLGALQISPSGVSREGSRREEPRYVKSPKASQKR